MRVRALGVLVLCLASAPLAAITYTVTSTADSGAGTLRQAILDANANPGADSIAFAIVGSGVQTIQPLSALPTVTDALTIDGYTQPGSSANTNDTSQGLNAVILIELDGTLAGAAAAGLTINASDTTIRGLVINRFGGDGISLTSGAFSGHTIQGCFIGTNAAGTLALGNRYGLFLGGGSTRLIGGTTPAARNLISGNDRAISTGDASSSGNTIQGNLMNTDVTGTINLGGVGIKFRVIKDSLVGGTDPAARNVIVGDDDILDLGYAIATTQTSGNFIQGNFLGTDVTGTKLLTSADHIIGIYNQPNTIGGSAPGAGNVIAGGTTRGNIWHEAAAGVVIQGNFIGADLTGTIPLGTSSFGIRLANGAVVGGTNPGEGNTIAFNGTAGVLPKGSGNSVRGNRIYQNGGLGIDLQTTGVTINDLGDGDAGDNLQQNFPLVTSVTYGAADTTIEGTLNSAASTVFDLDFYSSPVCQARPQDYREAHEYLGATQVTTDGSGNATFDVTLPVALDVGLADHGDRDRPRRQHVGAHAADHLLDLAALRNARGRRRHHDRGHAVRGGRHGRRGRHARHQRRRDGRDDDHRGDAGLARRIASRRDGDEPERPLRDALERLGRQLQRRAGQRPVLQPGDQARRQRDHRGGRRRQLRHRPVDAAPADGGVPAEGEVRPLLRAASLHRDIRGRDLPLRLRALDRGPRRGGHHRRLRRGQLLPRQSRAPRPDGRLHPQGGARLRLRAAGLRRGFRRRRRAPVPSPTGSSSSPRKA